MKVILRTILILFFLSTSAEAFNIRPVPWLTEEAIAFLEIFIEEHPSAKILEFGSGASTLWFAKRNVELVSVEHNSEWFQKISGLLKDDSTSFRVNYILSKLPYYTITEQFPDEYFDLILVDGRNRKGCIFFSTPKLKNGGILMLDNAERPYYFAALEALSDWQRVDSLQTKPDTCGFTYPGWITSWWVKPVKKIKNYRGNS